MSTAIGESAVHISVHEYLNTSYKPDVDYVEGKLEEREAGQFDHAAAQSLILGWFLSQRKTLGLSPFVELRIQVKPDRYRVADVCVLRARPSGQIVTEPPLVCIEVLSPDDRMARVQRVLADYHEFGVPYGWLVDPYEAQAYRYTGRALETIEGRVLRCSEPAFELPLDDIFNAAR